MQCWQKSSYIANTAIGRTSVTGRRRRRAVGKWHGRALAQAARCDREKFRWAPSMPR